MTVSIGSILANARSALVGNQAAINVTAQNISNAETEGYSRKRAEIVTANPYMTPDGQLASGIEVKDVTRIRDRLLDVSYRTSSSEAAGSRRRSELLGQVESLFSEPSSTGLSASLDQMFDAFAALATDPLNDTNRTVVRTSAEQVIGQFRSFASGLDQLTVTTAQRVNDEAAEVNRLTSDIARLNVKIVAAEAGGQTAGDLRDMRDLAVDRLSSYLPVQVVERSSGAIGVTVNGAMLVDNADATMVRIDTTGGSYRMITSRGITIDANASGSIPASLTVLNKDIPAARAQLDTIARAVVSDINAAHAAGTNPLGQTGIAFFDDFGNLASVSAANIALSSAVIADVRSIAAGTGGTDPVTGNPVYKAGTGDIALRIAQLRDATANPALGGASIGGSYASLVSKVGLDVRTARENTVASDAMVSQSDIRRQSVSGVSVDEELVQLIRFQNAYAAAARVVTVADEMLQELVNMKR
jgi:flagellar hook-associated protein 1 FlgK